MEPVWLRSYQEGVPSAIDPDQYATLNELATAAMTSYGPLTAYVNMGQTITYAELDQQSRAFAAYLQNVLKVRQGDKFAIMLPNIIQYPIAMFGALRAGCVVVNVNPLYTVDEVEHQLRDAQPVGILVLENFAHTVESALKRISIKNVMVTKISDVFPIQKSFLVDFIVKYVKHMVPKWHIKNYLSYRQAIRKGSELSYTEPHLTGQDLAFLQYTGGTTGRAKGAMLSHRNVVANVLQASAWISQLIEPRKEIVITALPLYHIFSLTANCLTLLHYGAMNVLITNPRDTKSFLKDLKKYQFTVITGVNTLYNLLINQPDLPEVDFSALKLSVGSGMPVQRAVAEKWQQITGKPILEAYGLTEASPAVCVNPMNLTRFNGTVGLPISSTEISVRDDQNNELNINETGELCVRGPQVMQGYWQNPKETGKVLSGDGWLRTGDIVKVDQHGYVHIIDRLKDMIIVSGFNVYPNEIEDVIALLPGVREVAVVGVPDQAHGEIVKAFIVRNDIKLTSETVREYCQQHLTAYKVPKQVEFRESLPKSNVGKILRRALR